MPDGSGGLNFLHVLEQEGLVKALWVCGTGLILFFFKEIYYAPTKFLTIVSFKEWKDNLGVDIQENKDNLQKFIDKQSELEKEGRDKQEKRDEVLYKSLNNRDNELRQFIVLTMKKGDKDE